MVVRKTMTDREKQRRMDGGYMGNRHDTGFRQVQSLLERAYAYLQSELPIKGVKKGVL